MRRVLLLALVLFLVVSLSGCGLTKIVTVPVEIIGTVGTTALTIVDTAVGVVGTAVNVVDTAVTVAGKAVDLVGVTGGTPELSLTLD